MGKLPNSAGTLESRLQSWWLWVILVRSKTTSVHVGFGGHAPCCLSHMSSFRSWLASAKLHSGNPNQQKDWFRAPVTSPSSLASISLSSTSSRAQGLQGQL